MDLHKLLDCFDSRPDLQAIRVCLGKPPRVVVHDAAVALDCPDVTAEAIHRLVGDLFTPLDREHLDQQGFVSTRHPVLPMIVFAERTDRGYELWCQRTGRPETEL